jgi:hypothetical protein
MTFTFQKESFKLIKLYQKITQKKGLLITLHSKVLLQIIVAIKIFFPIFYYSFIHMCVHCLGHFSSLPPSPTLSLPLASLPGRTCSALISNFVEEKT